MLADYAVLHAHTGGGDDDDGDDGPRRMQTNGSKGGSSKDDSMGEGGPSSAPEGTQPGEGDKRKRDTGRTEETSSSRLRVTDPGGPSTGPTQDTVKVHPPQPLLNSDTLVMQKGTPIIQSMGLSGTLWGGGHDRLCKLRAVGQGMKHGPRTRGAGGCNFAACSLCLAE
jgi:hypothetical protein